MTTRITFLLKKGRDGDYCEGNVPFVSRADMFGLLVASGYDLELKRGLQPAENLPSNVRLVFSTHPLVPSARMRMGVNGNLSGPVFYSGLHDILKHKYPNKTFYGKVFDLTDNPQAGI